MAQLMFARRLQQSCRQQVVIEGYDLPDWNLSAPKSQPRLRPDLSVGSHLTRAKYVSAMIDWLKPPCLNIDGVIIREGNFIAPDDYLDLFPISETEGTRIPDDHLLVNVRAGDVAQLPNMGARGDFQTIRRAKNIAISVSSFSWPAAYLSQADCIHVPVAGMLDPCVRADIDMLPLRDNRFIYHHISASAWANRYAELFPSRHHFSPLARREVAKLKRSANRRKLLASLRIHAGLARRMLFPPPRHRARSSSEAT